MSRLTPLIVLALILLSTGARAQALRGDADLQTVVDALRGKSFTDLKREFDRDRVPIYDRTFRNLIIDTNIRQGDLKLLTDKSQERRARERVLPILRLYGRESIDIVVFESLAPNAICIGGTAIFYSSAMLELAGDEELQAITAHELGHEYVNAVALAAREKADYAALRRVELTCDAFAVAALKELRIDPAEYKSILRKLTRSPYAVSWKGDGTDTHPSLQARLEAIDLLGSALIGK